MTIELDNKEMSRIANFEAGTDGITSEELEYVANMEAGMDLMEDESLESGVTDNAPYQNLAEYKMVPQSGEGESTQSNQRS